MATGRSLLRFLRVYVDGYDLSGYARSLGPLTWDFGEADLTADVGDAVRGVLPDRVMIGVGTLNGVFDNDAAGMFAAMAQSGGKRVVCAAQGIRAAPGAGDPCFCGEFEQKEYTAVPGDAGVTASIPFLSWSARGASLLYAKPWGTVLHPNGAETAANSAGGLDDYGAATTAGGYMVYHLLASDGTVTLKVQDAATNNDAQFADLSGATSGSIDATSTPAAGIVALGTDATVRRYLRWQLAFGTATSATFVLAFVRG